MYSLNVPVPGAVSSQAWDLRSVLTGFERLRDEHTLVIKRLEARSAGEFAALERAIREELTGTAPFEVEITGLGIFREPTTEPGPVLYFDVQSPGLVRLHEKLVSRFGAVGEIEGADYTPHITLARGGGDPSVIDDLLDMEGPTHRWTVDRLVFWDARRELPAGEVSLPA